MSNKLRNKELAPKPKTIYLYIGRGDLKRWGYIRYRNVCFARSIIRTKDMKNMQVRANFTWNDWSRRLVRALSNSMEFYLKYKIDFHDADKKLQNSFKASKEIPFKMVVLKSMKGIH